MITYALHAFFCCEKTDQIYIVAEKPYRDEILEDALSYGMDTEKIKGFALPGENRQGSILNGMRAMIGDIAADAVDEKDTVIIHDAARPFVTTQLLDRCYEALDGHDGVMPVLPMKDTVYRSTDGKRVKELLNRSEIFAGQAPELFRLKPYYKANMKLLPDGIKRINGATEPAVMQNMDIVMIDGDEKNFKVTTAEDLLRFKRILDESAIKEAGE